MNNPIYLILLLPATLIAGTQHQKRQIKSHKSHKHHITKEALTQRTLKTIARYDQQQLNTYLAQTSAPHRRRLIHSAIAHAPTTLVKKLVYAPHISLHARDSKNRTPLRHAITTQRSPVICIIQKRLKQKARHEQTACSICLTTDKPHKDLFALPCCQTVLCNACKDQWRQAQLFGVEYEDKTDITCPVCRAPMES